MGRIEEMDVDSLRATGETIYTVLGSSRAVEIGFEMGMEAKYCKPCEAENPHFKISDEEDDEEIYECFVCGSGHHNKEK